MTDSKQAFCTGCKGMVPTHGRGQCVVCGRATLGSRLGATRPINPQRVDRLYEEALAEYNPATLELKDACRYLAEVKERLDSVRRGAPEHQRLMAMWTDLSTQLRQARGTTPRASDASYDALSDEQLVERLEETALAARASLTLKQQHASIAPAPEHTAEAAAIAPAPEPAPPALCEHCRKPETACKEMQAERLEIWRAIHSMHPEEVERRNQEATATMFRTMAHGSGITRW